MPKPLTSTPVAQPKSPSTRLDAGAPMVVADDLAPAVTDASSKAPAGDAFATSNAFEDAARGAFVSGQGGAQNTAPSANSLAVRAQNAAQGAAEDGVPSPLDSMRALVPAASTLGQTQAQALVKLINASIAKAIDEGDSVASLRPRDVDRLLGAWDAPHEGYQPIADALEQLGYRAHADGFTGVDVLLAAASAPVALGAQELARELERRLPAPPGGAADPGARLSELVNKKLDAAAAKGKTSIDLETGELDRILGRGGPSYDDVAKALGELGYQTFADGFIGVSASWPKSDEAKPSPSAFLTVVAAGVTKPQSAPSGVDALVALVESKLAGAMSQGEKSFDLSTSELDRLLKGTIGGGSGYKAVADALKERGYQAFADGFMGVSAGWK